MMFDFKFYVRIVECLYDVFVMDFEICYCFFYFFDMYEVFFVFVEEFEVMFGVIFYVIDVVFVCDKLIIVFELCLDFCELIVYYLIVFYIFLGMLFFGRFVLILYE